MNNLSEKIDLIKSFKGYTFKEFSKVLQLKSEDELKNIKYNKKKPSKELIKKIDSLIKEYNLSKEINKPDQIERLKLEIRLLKEIIKAKDETIDILKRG